jgi:predicted dehydrogenase
VASVQGERGQWTKSTLRVGIVGTGFGVAGHVPAWRAVQGVEVVTLCGGRRERAEAAAAQAGIPIVVDSMEALAARDDLQIISVASPPHLHHAHTLLALRAGKHVLCEKPFTADLGQARELLAEAERRRLIHAIAHEFRYLPRRRQLKAMIDSHYVGTPRLTTWRQHSYFMWDRADLPWGWLSRADQGGGFLGPSGSHLIDALCDLFGDVSAVGSMLSSFVPARRLPAGEPAPDGYAVGDNLGRVTADDSFALLLRFAGGLQAVIQATAAAPPPAADAPLPRMGHNLLEVVGSAGVLRLEDDTQLTGWRAGNPIAEHPLPADLDLSPDPRDYRIAPLAELMRRMVAAIRGEPHDPYPTFADGMRVQAVLDAARRADAGLTPVALW